MKGLKNSYFKGFVMLLSGSILAQIISLVFAPIITRLYLPEQMGVLTLFLSVVSMFGVVICARYDMVIISTDRETYVYSLMVLSQILSILFSFIITFVFFIYVKCVPELNNLIGSWSLIIFPVLIIQGITNTLTAYNNRFKEYELMSRVNVIRVSAQGILQVIFGMLHFDTLGLLISYLASTIMGIRSQSKRLYQNLYELKKTSWYQIKKVMIEYKNQPIYSVPAIFLNSASYSILPFMIYGQYGTTQVGYFSISFRLLGVPLALISTNISRIYFQRASEEYNSGYSFRETFKNTTLLLLIITIPLFSILYFYGPQIIVTVFGANWSGAGIFIKLLSPMYGIRLIVSTLSVTLIIVNKQKYDMFLQATFFIVTIISYIIANSLHLALNSFIILISTLYTINYLIYWMVSYKLSKGG